ncbi:urea ABC transporter permease subunit UrtB [Celeribacter arenosi]|uniref:Urea ABC transporter permease subunit UrtB n=1 Tax=Celeribacter arenosi TaxID=792649 RepID=A0ABP7K1N7_9RHOB
MIRFLAALVLFATFGLASMAQDRTLQSILSDNAEVIVKSSRTSIAPAIEAVAFSDMPGAQSVLEKWQAKELWFNETDGQFYYATKAEGDTYALTDIITGDPAGQASKAELEQIKPNSGVRAMLAAALVKFQLEDPDPAVRRAALDAISRDGEAAHLAPLRASIDGETDPDIKAIKTRTERILTITYGEGDEERVSAINYFEGALSVEARGALNPLVVTRVMLAENVPDNANVKGDVRPGTDALGFDAAYALLVDDGRITPQPTIDERKAALLANRTDGTIAGVALATLNTQEARDSAYQRLAAAGTVPSFDPDFSIEGAARAAKFVEIYTEPSAAVTAAAEATLTSIKRTVSINQFLDLTLDGLSLASIYFLAAIGLAITFGVMGVINMAHGEFIMMGAYTGYVVQQIIPDYTLSIIVAIPMAFAVTFAAGVAMERLIIRWLYNRPLETLLATFGVSIALQQIAKNIFGTQARPLTSPGWLDGALVFNDVLAISYIRIAIFVLALIFLGVFLFIMKRTRLGLETRAVTQNPRMAASMGINPDRVNMMTFGLGSGIAGIAGVAIGLYAKVTSELGSDYIVQSFMTVVVGGVGNIWGTLLGAGMIGFLQKGIEWLNPSNTLAAQTYMIVFIIIFIQFRPKGIIALKGRAAGD